MFAMHAVLFLKTSNTRNQMIKCNVKNIEKKKDAPHNLSDSEVTPSNGQHTLHSALTP